MSPLTISSPRAAASRPETTSPVLTPIRSPTSASCRSAIRAAKPANRRGQRAPCQHGSLGVVLVRLRHAEHRQDGVADELLGHAAEALDVTVDEREQLTLQLANLLRIEALP